MAEEGSRACCNVTVSGNSGRTDELSPDAVESSLYLSTPVLTAFVAFLTCDESRRATVYPSAQKAAPVISSSSFISDTGSI